MNDNPSIGHNSVSADRLKSFVQRIECLEQEKKEITDDIGEIYKEAKSSGYDTKTIRQVISLRKISEQERKERSELLDLYLGVLSDTPLGLAAKKAASS